MFRVVLMVRDVVVGIFEMPTHEAALERLAYVIDVCRRGESAYVDIEG